MNDFVQIKQENILQKAETVYYTVNQGSASRHITCFLTSPPPSILSLSLSAQLAASATCVESEPKAFNWRAERLKLPSLAQDICHCQKCQNLFLQTIDISENFNAILEVVNVLQPRSYPMQLAPRDVELQCLRGFVKLTRGEIFLLFQLNFINFSLNGY